MLEYYKCWILHEMGAHRLTVSNGDIKEGGKTDTQTCLVSTNTQTLTFTHTERQCVSEAGSIGLPEDTLSVFIAEVLVD